MATNKARVQDGPVTLSLPAPLRNKSRLPCWATTFPISCAWKTNHTPPKYSVYAAIMPIKKCNAANASQEFTRHHERHGDRFKNCELVNSPAGAQTESGTETYLHKPMCGTE